MNKISKLNSKTLQKTANIQTSKKTLKDLSKAKSSKLEKTPIMDCFDFSMEEFGFFMRKDFDGNILKRVKTRFPR